ncbi:MAG: EAL domain-containing protein [Thermoleophilaceae bacterium]
MDPREHAALRWWRRNGLMAIAAAVLLSSMIGAGILVRTVAERDEPIREAQIALARAQPMAQGLIAQPRLLVSGYDAGERDFFVNGAMRVELRRHTRALGRAWPGQLSDAIRAQARRTSVSNRRFIDLLRDREDASARRYFERVARPAATRLAFDIRQAEEALAKEADAAERRAFVATLAITAIIGVLLVIMLIAVVTARRRHERAETEERVVRESEERLRHQAFHDDLTGLANRGLFGDRLEHALARAERSGGEVAVLLFDLDDFKSINDSLGHSAGDLLLSEVGRRLTDSIRVADTIARLGGDEFALLIEGGSPDDDARTAQRLLTVLAEPIEIDGRSFPISASVGVARAAGGESTADRLVRDADLAMYSAKARQKGMWATYRPEMHEAIQERLQLKADLARSVPGGSTAKTVSESGELELHYQPVVAIDSGEIHGFEALLRWNHPVRGQLAPSDFLALAEETGAIVPVGRWVIHEACRQGRRWQDLRGSTVNVGVNLSARQLDAPGLIDDVRGALAASGLPPRDLVLEITETGLIADIEQGAEVLEALKELGVRIAIDDFGAGYSSLSQLERLPIDVLKVDRGFAAGASARTARSPLLRAVVEIGDSLGMLTIVEGIETPAQLEELRTIGCPLGQGYLFSRAVAAAEVDVMIRSEPAERAPRVPWATAVGPAPAPAR